MEFGEGRRLFPGIALVLDQQGDVIADSRVNIYEDVGGIYDAEFV